MKDENKNEPTDIICTCTGTTKTKVNQLITKGYDNLDKIASATGCGSCDILIMELLEKK